MEYVYAVLILQSLGIFGLIFTAGKLYQRFSYIEEVLRKEFPKLKEEIIAHRYRLGELSKDVRHIQENLS